MARFGPFRSLRARLLAASLLVEVIMLTLLVANSMRLIEDHVARQAENRIHAIELAYKTAVAAPLAARDYATLRDILEGWKQAEDVRYLAVSDRAGKILVAVGWPKEKPLPAASTVRASDDIIHIAFEADYLGASYGRVQYGLSSAFLRDARDSLVQQSVIIAVLGLTVTFLLLLATTYWVMRDFGALADASRQVAAGNYDIHLPLRGEDEVATVGRRFVEMAAAVKEQMLAQRQANEELAHAATHDALTGLNNRRAFEDALEAELARPRDADNPLYVFYIDLDQFKLVNDTCGHVAGDALLMRLARVMETRLSFGFLARLGGDEFGMILSGMDTDAAERHASKIIDEIRALSFTWEGKSFRIGASIGIAQYSRDLDSVTSLLMAADTACYAAKERGRNRAQFYLPADRYFQERQADYLSLTQIADALGSGRLVLFGQRIKAFNPALTDYIEVLVRMVSSEGAIIPPSRFIPAAERYGMMPLIDRWVLQATCRQLAAWRRKGLPLPHLHVNLSGQTLAEPGLTDYIQATFANDAIEPADFGFEITESCAIAQLDHALAFIRFCGELGCELALDDFGSGLSSFGYLKRFKVQTLKIDGQFVKNADRDDGDRAVIESMVHLASRRGLHTVAEFVCSDAVLATVRELGVDYGQGFAIHVPGPLSEML